MCSLTRLLLRLSVPLFRSLLSAIFQGMNLGLLISSVAKIEAEAVQMALATFFPSLLLSGVMWPLEAVGIEFS